MLRRWPCVNLKVFFCFTSVSLLRSIIPARVCKYSINTDMMSVLVITLALAGGVLSRSLSEDLDNELSPNPADNLAFANEWVQINRFPAPVTSENYGARVELFCEAMGSPPPTLQWFKRNTRLTENQPNYETNYLSDGPSMGLATVRSKLVINYLLPRHQDVYRCVAESGNKVTSAVTKIIVVNKEGRRDMNLTQLLHSKILGAHHVPTITFWATTYMNVIGSDVYLPCKTVGNPKPTLTWLDDNGVEVKNNDDERYRVLPDGELRIKSIKWSDMGGYTCVVSNMKGEDSITTFLYPMKESSRER